MKTPQDIAKLISEDIKQNNGLIYENLYGLRVVDGNNPIDRFIAAIERNYLDFDMKDQKVQELASKLFKKVPSNDELVGLIKSSEQDDELKKHLIGLLGVSDDNDVKYIGHYIYYIWDEDGIYPAEGDWGHIYSKDELPLITSVFREKRQLAIAGDLEYKDVTYDIIKTLYHLKDAQYWCDFDDAVHSDPDFDLETEWKRLAKKYPEMASSENSLQKQLFDYQTLGQQPSYMYLVVSQTQGIK